MKMMAYTFGVLVVLASGVGASDARSQVTPIAKVLQLLNDMHAKGIAEMNEEQSKFASFSQWCTDQDRVKTEEIAQGKEQMEMLDATIQKAAARIRALTDRVQELEEDVGRWKTDEKSATDVREKEKSDYTATAQDYTESLDALDQAIAVLKKQAYDRAQPEFLQTVASVAELKLVPLSTKKALSAFLQQEQPDLAEEAMPNEDLFYKPPEANAYDFQSGGVIEMLEKLKDEFTTKKTDLDMEELNAQHAYEGMMQTLADNIENAEHEASNKKTASAQTAEAKSEAEGNLAQTTADHDEDVKYKDDMNAMCKRKNSDFESRQTLRKEELETLAKAIEIISSGTVAGAGEKHLPTLLQTKKGQSFAQIRGSQQSPMQDRIAAFLSDRANSCNSHLLALVSQRVASDPFTKVKKMIKDLIVKLMEEGTAETEHKGWCDTELATNKVTREERTEEVNQLTSEIEDLTATIAQLGQDISDLNSAIAEVSAAMTKATADRTDSKATNEATITEAKDAQVAVTQAISILKDFYAKAAEATALTQQSPEEDAPETFDAPYTGMQPSGGSVVDFLEVILSDFTRLEAETSSTEAQEKEEYDKFMFESEKDKALKENELGHKESTKTEKESNLHSTQAELKGTQEQLDKAMEYYEKLKPTCVDSGITYEERVKRREEEIQSLQEALKILTGSDI